MASKIRVLTEIDYTEIDTINQAQTERIDNLSKVVVESGNSMTQSIQELRDAKADTTELPKTMNDLIVSYENPIEAGYMMMELEDEVNHFQEELDKVKNFGVELNKKIVDKLNSMNITASTNDNLDVNVDKFVGITQHKAINTILTTQGSKQNIPQGYYPQGSVTAKFNNLTASNVKSGVNIGGVTGSYKGEERKRIATLRVPPREKRSTTVYVNKGSDVLFMMEDEDIGTVVNTAYHDSGGVSFSPGYPYQVKTNFYDYSATQLKVNIEVENESSSWDYTMYVYHYV